MNTESLKLIVHLSQQKLCGIFLNSADNQLFGQPYSLNI